MSVRTSDYGFDLPKELIAQDPPEDRSASRLLLMDRQTGAVSHEIFRNIVDYLDAGDCLVLNNTRVLPARLMGIKRNQDDTGTSGDPISKPEIFEGMTGATQNTTSGMTGATQNTTSGMTGATQNTTSGMTGATQNSTSGMTGATLNATSGTSGTAVEVLLLRRRKDDIWETLVKPGKKARPGAVISFGGGLLTGRVAEVTEEGNRLIQFTYQGVFEEILDRLGEMPLPPYITHKLQDKSRYQTVYAQYDGSAAAPTAGLHFTAGLLEAIAAKGVRLAYVTLHVGLGTFRPVKTENVTEHHMHSEYYEISGEAAAIINETRKNGGRVICVGTTSCRTIESAAYKNTMESGYLLKECRGDTDIFIYPGYRFRIMDGLITNFHLPESTLLMLVSAFAGREHVLTAYETAIKEKYRFFSFGDAMYISNHKTIS